MSPINVINMNESLIAHIGANIYRLERRAKSARTTMVLWGYKEAFDILEDTANAIAEDAKFLDKELCHSLKNIVARHREQFDKNCEDNPNNIEMRR